MDALLTTKLHPPRQRSRFLRRDQLLRRMHGGLVKQLTLVSAPAGFGKSTLLSMWVGELTIPVGWLSLDEHDNDPARFWHYVRATLQSSTSLSLGAASPGEHDLIDMINVLTAAAAPVVLVLDDYHLITNLSIHRQIGRLIEHQPPNLHLVIATRADPPLALARLRAHNQMHDIRVADLRLTVDETRDFCSETMDLRLAPDDVQALTLRTEGWLAGLQLAALSLQQQTNPRAFIEQFTGRQQYVMEYLTEEVLAQLPEQVYEFLLATSLLDQLTAPLCDAVLETTGSQELLLQLYAGNLFLFALDETRTWFRYHHLFGELLRARFVQTRGSDSAAACFQRAAAWCEAQRLPEQAIRYALAGHDDAGAVRLIEEHWNLVIHRGELQLLSGWLDAVSPAAYAASAPLNMIRCWILDLTGQAGAVREQLRRTREAWAAQTADGATPTHTSWPVIPSLMETVEAIVALYEQRPHDALIHAQQALTLIPPEIGAYGAAVLRGAAMFRLAHAYRAMGDLQAAAATLAKACDDLLAGGNTLGLAKTLTDLAGLWEHLGRDTDALALCGRAIAYIEARGETDLPIAGMIYAAMAAAQVRNGNSARGLEFLERAEDLGRRGSQSALQLAGRVRAQLSRSQPLTEPLSERELEVLALMCKGQSNQEIAEQLVISLSTVKKHSGNIFGKLGVTSRTQAILQAQTLGLI